MEIFTFTSGKLEVKVRSGSRQGQVKFRSNKVQSPNTIFFMKYACLVQVCARTQKINPVLVYDYKKRQKSHFKNIKTFVPALHRNSCAEVKFFFIARYAEGTKSIDFKTTAIASVVYPLLILVTFRAVLNQCAAVTA